MPYKEKDRWRGVVTLNGERAATKMWDTKKDAAKWEREKRKRLKNIEKRVLKGMDLATFCVKYLDYSKRFSKKTYNEKKSVCTKIMEAWGANILVFDINSEMAEKYLTTQKETRSANASNKDRKNLLAMWKKGVKTFGVEKNPFEDTEKYPHDRSPQPPPSPDDVLKVLLASTRKERVLLDTCLETAARRSSLFRLTWHDDINFEQKKIRIGTKKTKDGSMKYHWLDMSDDLYDSLMWWWRNRTIPDSPYVFVDDWEGPEGQRGPHYGKPYTQRRRFLPGLCKRAEIKTFGFHALRRFVASVFADTHKVSTKKIQYILGHASLNTTEKYIYNIDSDLKSVMNLPKIIVDNSEEENKEKDEK